MNYPLISWKGNKRGNKQPKWFLEGTDYHLLKQVTEEPKVGPLLNIIITNMEKLASEVNQGQGRHSCNDHDKGDHRIPVRRIKARRKMSNVLEWFMGFCKNIISNRKTRAPSLN